MDQLDDIRFWSHQLSEHALFLHLGLEVEPFKSRAKALHDDWEHARSALVTAPTLEAAKAIASGPTTNLATFSQDIVNRQLAGQWLGWLFPLFVSHTLRELKYFVARVWEGGLTRETTYCQNVVFMREHAEFAAHLLDPQAAELIRTAHSIGDQFGGLGAGCKALTPALVELGLKAGHELDQYLRTQPISPKNSVIHPVLAEHVVREGERFLATMKELETHPS